MITLDAAAAIDIAVDNLADGIDELLGNEVVVPPTFYVETASYALRTAPRMPDLVLEMRDLMWSLVTDVEALDPHLAQEAWTFCGSLSFPDATYVAVAARHGAALWTTDARLDRHPGCLPCDVRLLRRRRPRRATAAPPEAGSYSAASASASLRVG